MKWQQIWSKFSLFSKAKKMLLIIDVKLLKLEITKLKLLAMSNYIMVTVEAVFSFYTLDAVPRHLANIKGTKQCTGCSTVYSSAASPSSPVLTFRLRLIRSVTASGSIIFEQNSNCHLPHYTGYIRTTYLSDRQQYVKLGGNSSGLLDSRSDVPQGSVVAPLLFAAYVAPVGAITESFGVRYQQYADDTQLYLCMKTSDSAHHRDILRTCSTAVHDWYLANSLLLNADKSDVILLVTANQLRVTTSVDLVKVAGVTLPVASSEVNEHHSGPATHVRRPSNGRSQVLQLPHLGNQACSPSSVRVCGSDVSAQLNQQLTRLLQLATARSSRVD